MAFDVWLRVNNRMAWYLAKDIVLADTVPRANVLHVAVHCQLR